MTGMRGAVLFCLAALLALALFSDPALAQGLQKAQSVLETLQTELELIVPVAAAIILLILGVAYAAGFIHLSTFVNWAVGLIIAGSAVELTGLLFN